MTPDRMLSSLRRQGVQIWRDGSRLRYKAPAEALTPELLEQLREQKAALLDFLRSVDDDVGTRMVIQPTTREMALPPSFAQESLWFFDKLTPKSALYNLPLMVRLRGPLNAAVLQQSLSEVVRRHEVLRTAFNAINGTPVQRLLPHSPLELPIVDLTAMSPDQQDAGAKRLCQADALRSFDLSRDLMLHVKLFQFSATEHVLFLNMHHIASDGWSIGVLMRELKVLYDAFSDGQPSPLPEMPIQYTDFSVWQRGWLQGDVLEKQLGYWRKQLAGAPPLLELPTDHPRPASQTYRGAMETVTLPQSLVGDLKALARQEGVSLFMTLLAAFQTLLHRYTSQEDIIVGSPIANRNRAEIEGLIGFFVNTLVLRTSFSGSPTFGELLGRVREVCWGAYAHQDLPFEKLVEQLQPQRNLSYHPLFQVTFSMQDAFPRCGKLNGLEFKLDNVLTDTAKFDLSFEAEEQADGLSIKAEYCTDLFEADTIRRMLGHYRTLLEGISADTDRRVAYLPLLTPPERDRVLLEWNATEQAYPQGQCLHDLFEAQVKRTPDAIAVVFEDRQLTYRELNACSNQLAHDLRMLGVGADVLVGLYLERSIEMVIALFGILKAGGAYLPLDPSYPVERLSVMLEDAKPAAVVTQQSLVSTLPGMNSTRTVFLDGVIWRKAGNTDDPTRISNDENLAYVLFTSGSTGKPKGAMISHRAIVNHMRWMQSAFPMDARDVVFQKTPLSFDASVWEFFAPLLSGGQLLLARPGGQRDPAYLVETIRQRGVTVLQVVPTLLQMLLEVPEFRNCRSLRHVFCGGEALNGELAGRFFQILPAKLHNLYGPTEVTIDSVFHSVLPGSLTAVIPIGRPVANTRAYVLDAHLQPVPVGVPGELYLGGPQVGRGYLNRPELTAERFLPDPFRPDERGRLYKTGDKVRYRPDGNIEFLGRMDHQVKIRGFRIELGEVEAVLRHCSGVRECVVLARDDGPGEKRLVAYLAGGSEELPATAELRRLMQRQLPEFMVPAAFVRLNALPQTPNGKVDRRALPPLALNQLDMREALVAPRDAVEEQLVSLWQETLAVKPIGVTDNFFHLGGNSLQAVRLFARIEDTFRKRLPLATLFQSPTIEQLASALRSHQAETTWSSLVPIQPRGTKPPFFCVHARGGNVLSYRNLADRLGPDQPFYAFQAQGLDGKTPFMTRIEDMAALYIREMKTVQPQGPYFLGGSSFGGIGAFEMAQQLLAAGDEVALLAVFDTGGPGYPKMTPVSAVTYRRHQAQNFVNRIQHHLWTLSTLKRGERVAYVREQIRKKVTRWRVRIAARIPTRLATALFPAYENVRGNGLGLQRAIDIAFASYVYRPYPARLTLFRASEQPVGIYPDATLGWGRIVTGELEIHEVQGSHGTLGKEPGVRFLAEILKACIAKAQIREGTPCP